MPFFDQFMKKVDQKRKQNLANEVLERNRNLNNNIRRYSILSQNSEFSQNSFFFNLRNPNNES
jgi:hypothetical protein